MYDIIELSNMSLEDLIAVASGLGIEKIKSATKEDLIYRILDEQAIKNIDKPLPKRGRKKGAVSVKNKSDRTDVSKSQDSRSSVEENSLQEDNVRQNNQNRKKGRPAVSKSKQDDAMEPVQAKDRMSNQDGAAAARGPVAGKDARRPDGRIEEDENTEKKRRGRPKKAAGRSEAETGESVKEEMTAGERQSNAVPAQARANQDQAYPEAKAKRICKDSRNRQEKRGNAYLGPITRRNKFPNSRIRVLMTGSRECRFTIPSRIRTWQGRNRARSMRRPNRAFPKTWREPGLSSRRSRKTGLRSSRFPIICLPCSPQTT